MGLASYALDISAMNLLTSNTPPAGILPPHSRHSLGTTSHAAAGVPSKLATALLSRAHCWAALLSAPTCTYGLPLYW
jgi:hypothetical protein